MKEEIPEETIDVIAKHINDRSNKPSTIPIITIEGQTETPHYFEITPFDKLDDTDRRFYAIDGSSNSQEFYNGLCIGVYTAGYVCYQSGKQVRMNSSDDPVILGKSYFPQNILISNEAEALAIFDELLELEPVKNLLQFFGDPLSDVWGFGANTRELMSSNLSKLLSFCQEILEWALILEIINLKETKIGDFILRDGTLRSPNIEQKYLVKLGKYVKEKGVIILAVTKNSPIKMELSSTFKKIDNYLQDDLKPKYPFAVKDPRRQKLCCWFEVPDDILSFAYKGSMYAVKNIKGGRGFGLFTAARLDYVEKLQNYDWVVIDLNIFDAMPEVEVKDLKKRDMEKIKLIFQELTRLTQEHYILGYPYPLVEAHNFVTLTKDFKQEIVKRVKYSLYKNQIMDNVDIENLFLDIHDRF